MIKKRFRILLAGCIIIIIIIISSSMISLSVALAESSTHVRVTTYALPVVYANSNHKDNALITSAYACLETGLNQSIEFGVDHMILNYIDSTTLNQTDLTLVYTRNIFNSWKIRCGGHYLQTDEDFKNQAKIGFAGLNYFMTNQWQVQLDGYVSQYDSLNPELYVYQFTPKIGYYLGNRTFSGLYTETKGYFIHLSRNAGAFDKDFVSMEGSLTGYYGGWYSKISAWTGYQAFAVRNDGFCVYNSAETFSGGYGVSVGYTPPWHIHFETGLYRQYFSDPEDNNTAIMDKAMISFSVNF